MHGEPWLGPLVVGSRCTGLVSAWREIGERGKGDRDRAYFF